MELKAKQDYLFKEILEANYDPEVFQEFMEREQGANLDVYSMQQLVELVQKFKRAANPELYPPEQPQQQQEPQEQQERELEESRMEALPASSGDAKGEERQGKRGETYNTSTRATHQFVRKEQLPELYRRVHVAGESVRVRIRSYSKESEESLFGGTFVAYLLECGAWSVRRRFKDFEWLSARLALAYPGLPIPPIPRKTAVRSFEDRHLEERMVCFERFVNRLVAMPEVCSDAILEEFLSVPGQQEWTNCKGRFDIRLANQGTRLTTLRGEDTLNTAEFAVEARHTQGLAASLQLTRHLNTLLAAFQKALRTATEQAFELAATLGQAHAAAERDGVRGSGVVELMGEFMREVGHRLDGESFFVKANLEDYWAYEEKYQEGLLTALSRANRDHLDLLARAKHLPQADLDQEAPRRPLADYLAAKEQYRIRLSFTLDELQRYRTHDLPLVARDWAQALTQHVATIKDLMLSGADQLTKAMCVCEGKQLREVHYLSPRTT